MSIPCKFASAAEAKKGNWFSRRHQTSAEHHEASKTREARLDAQFQATAERVRIQDEYAAARKLRLAAKVAS